MESTQPLTKLLIPKSRLQAKRCKKVPEAGQNKASSVARTNFVLRIKSEAKDSSQRQNDRSICFTRSVFGTGAMPERGLPFASLFARWEQSLDLRRLSP